MNKLRLIITVVNVTKNKYTKAFVSEKYILAGSFTSALIASEFEHLSNKYQIIISITKRTIKIFITRFWCVLTRKQIEILTNAQIIP